MFSAIIAVRHEEEALVRTLASLVSAVAEGMLHDAAIIDSGDVPGIAAIADAAGCRRYEGGPAQALPMALSAARGQWVLALRPGVELEAGWFREAAEFVKSAATGDRPQCAAFTHARLSHGPAAHLSEAWRFVTGNLLGAVGPDQGLIIGRTALGHMPRSAVAMLPPRPPAGSRVVILRARAFAP
jgi:hypothetical protein